MTGWSPAPACLKAQRRPGLKALNVRSPAGYAWGMPVFIAFFAVYGAYLVLA